MLEATDMVDKVEILKENIQFVKNLNLEDFLFSSMEILKILKILLRFYPLKTLKI